ncbi:MAG: hypothetical protein LC640_10570, partial [Frankia sp.]|nr:hypothetical protein [Frankia sp.]
LFVAGSSLLYHSTDGGLTFTLVNNGNVPAYGKLLRDPANRRTGLIGPMPEGGVAISADGGATWKSYKAPPTEHTYFFPAIGADRAGNIYMATAGGYKGSGDKKQEGEVTFNYFNRKTQSWWKTPVRMATGPGDKMWAWLIAGDDGRVAIVWYETTDGKSFTIRAAVTTNAHGSDVRCGDGSVVHVGPKFSIVNASGRAIHQGAICLGGTGCNAETDFAQGDRRLGDFFTVNFDHTGRLFIVSGDTMLRAPGGGPKPVSNPIFIAQTAGASMLEHPDAVRPTRPLCALPNC